MSSSASVTHWITRLKEGDPDAAQRLWEGYYRRLVGLARQRLAGAPRRAADEEDIALSAFDSFCRGAQEGRFPQLVDRDDLWQLLVMIAARKAINLIQHEHRLKWGGGAVVLDEAALSEGTRDIAGCCSANLQCPWSHPGPNKPAMSLVPRLPHKDLWPILMAFSKVPFPPH